MGECVHKHIHSEQDSKTVGAGGCAENSATAIGEGWQQTHQNMIWSHSCKQRSESNMCDLARVWPEARGSQGGRTSRCFLLSCSPDKTFLVTQISVLLFRITQKVRSWHIYCPCDSSLVFNGYGASTHGWRWHESRNKRSFHDGKSWFLWLRKTNTLRSTHNDAAGSSSRLAYFSVDRNGGKSSWPHKINKALKKIPN